MYINVFKFGGAALNSSDGIKQVASIVAESVATPLLVVVSAMGKTTTALEDLLKSYLYNDTEAVAGSFRKVLDYHRSILDGLFKDKTHPVFTEVDSLFNQLREYVMQPPAGATEHGLPDYDYEYDRIVSSGELISSSIFQHFLVLEGFSPTLFDVRGLIRTDSTYRDARVDWQTTGNLIRNSIPSYFDAHPGPGTIALTQGFIGSDAMGNTTTLGREGSDFSAAIFARCLDSKEMTIWKDVPGVMNADPKWMSDAVCLESLSYREAIELAYYGASIIHPKTVKPLENAGIVLRVRSFSQPDHPGTIVTGIRHWNISIPIYIRKQDQVLISVSSRDFSFILEENLSEIFRILADFRVRVNVMHNSAISFSICVDSEPLKTGPLIEYLSKNYETRYNSGLELFTIRHYTSEAVDRIVNGRKIMMELRSRNTVQVVLA